MAEDADWNGYSACPLRGGNVLANGRRLRFSRGVPVLRFAHAKLRQHRELVLFLVWCNPSNLEYASFELQADAEVASTALLSPFYNEQEQPMPPFCVLKVVAPELLPQIVIDAVARSGYELEWAGAHLCANAEVVALAGAPGGAAVHDGLSETLVLLMKANVSVQHVHKHWSRIVKDDACAAALAGSPWSLIEILRHWPELAEELGPDTHQNGSKPGLCARIKGELQARFPLFWRVAPPVRNLLWPTSDVDFQQLLQF